MMAFLTLGVRFVGAFHTGVAMSLVPHGSSFAVTIAFGAGITCFALNCFWDDSGCVREVLLRGYAAPLTIVTGLFEVFSAPGSWHDAGLLVRQLIADVFTRTPIWVYPVGAMLGAYRAHVVARG